MKDCAHLVDLQLLEELGGGVERVGRVVVAHDGLHALQLERVHHVVEGVLVRQAVQRLQGPRITDINEIREWNQKESSAQGPNK